MNCIGDIKHSFYINLDSRPDRKKLVEYELQKVGIEPNRFNAIKLANGALGCSMSHLKCLETAKKNGWEHILIVEDDIKFTNVPLFQKQLTAFLSKHTDWNVILIAGNNIPPYQIIDDTCVKVTRCQTTTGYLVNCCYYDTLINNIKEGIKLLMREPDKHVMYAIDKYWFRLQEKDNWYLITPLTVVQEEGYSDIEKRMTNYKSSMVDLDKKWLFERQKMNENIIKNNSLKTNKPSMKINMMNTIK
jgi:GR25 family glycosyltransferase involved in LPS biosynthesis